MHDELTIGATPYGEDCEQLGSNYRPERARAECKAFIGQLRRHFGDEPPGARFKITSNPHDFGTYYEVVIRYDPEDEEAAEYAQKAENDAPEFWDDQAKRELRPRPEFISFTIGDVLRDKEQRRKSK